MRNYFTSLQVFIAGAFALVIFIGVLWAIQTNYVKFSRLENPFDSRQSIDERVVVSGSDSRSWLHSTGEVFMVMPGAKFNFINQARELEEGVVFVNTTYQDQAAIDRARQGLEPPFNVAQTRPGGGQIRVGPTMVSIPQGVAVLKRDLVRKEIVVYAHDHPVYIALPEAKEAFIVPPSYMVLLKEDRANLLSALFFTKLKKELSLQVLQPNTLGMESIQSSLIQGLELSGDWEDQMVEYAENQLVGTNRFAPDSLMGRLLSFLYHIQRYYALGIDNSFKAEYTYEQLRTELKNTYFAFLDRDKVRATEASLAFKQVKESAEWARHFIENPTYSTLWNEFARAQRVWFFAAFPEELEVTALRTLWGPSRSLETFKDYQENFYLYEKYLAQSYGLPARSQLEFMVENFENIDFEALENKNELTQARRQVSLLLQMDPKRSSSLIYDLYLLLVNTEQQFAIAENEFNQEIRLEVAQEMLLFLDELLDSNTRQDDVYNLLEVYNRLNIAQLADELGRSVFSNRERDTLEKVKSLSNTTEEQRLQILADNQSVNDLINAITEIRSKEPEVVFVPLGLQTQEDLIAQFEESRILVSDMTIQINERAGNRFMTFSQATFDNLPLSGTFNVELQQFTYLKLGEIEERRSPGVSNFVAFLRNMARDNAELNREETPEDLSVNINTSRALIQRRFILELLEDRSINARFDKVIPTNNELTLARVEEATFGKSYLLNFDFDLGPPIRVRNVEVRYGRNFILIPDRVFALDNLEEDLLEAIEEKIEASADNDDDGS